MSALTPIASLRVILASTSQYRRALLAPLGWSFECVASPFDEEAAKPGLAHLPVGDRALTLARRSANTQRGSSPEARNVPCARRP